MPSTTVTCSRGVRLVADALLADVASRDYDAVALPGGMPGAEHLRDCEPLRDLLLRQQARGGVIAAICAAPAVVLHAHGITAGRTATCYPAEGFRKALGEAAAVAPDERRVVVDGSLVTSQGPGTALEMALKLVEVLRGPEVAAGVGGAMLVQGDK